MKRIRTLVIAPYFDQHVAGESWCTFKWVQGICARTQATVLTTHTPGWDASRSPVETEELVNWTHHKLKGPLARFDHELKPHYIQFYRQARKWIKKALREGRTFDIVHQINPVALRYPSPAAGLGLTFFTGPHAGSLQTPKGLRSECKDVQWYRKLRNLDSLRLRLDPFMRRSFSEAAVVLGVAPYVRDLLRSIPLNRYENMAETGPSEVIEHDRVPTSESGPLKLLFVGRIIRTKGVIDAVRAFAIAKPKCDITFEIIGAGDMLEACRAEAARLGVSDSIVFRGRIPREEVFERFKQSDVFLFPSFREPSGTVVFEALGFGLPLITCNNGGPGYVITDECGIRVNPRSPQQYAADLAEAIVKLAHDRQLVTSMSRAALARVREVASWESRLERLIHMYHDTLANSESLHHDRNMKSVQEGPSSIAKA